MIPAIGDWAFFSLHLQGKIALQQSRTCSATVQKLLIVASWLGMPKTYSDYFWSIVIVLFSFVLITSIVFAELLGKFDFKMQRIIFNVSWNSAKELSKNGTFLEE